MKKDFPPTSPLPFKDFYEITPFTQEHALGDVVEPAPPTRPSFYFDDVNPAKGDGRHQAAYNRDSLGHEVSDHCDDDDVEARSSEATAKDEAGDHHVEAVTGRHRGEWEQS